MADNQGTLPNEPASSQQGYTYNPPVFIDKIFIYAAFLLISFRYIVFPRDIEGSWLSAQNQQQAAPDLFFQQISNLFLLTILLWSLIYFKVSRITKGFCINLTMLATAYYFFAFVFPPLVHGDFTEIDHALFYPVLGLLFIFIPVGPSERANEIHYALGITIITLLSLILAFASPSLVMLQDYESFIPGLSGRLYGLAPHANVLGMVSAVPILLIGTGRKIGYLMPILLINSVAMLLSQSKTSIGSCLAAIAVIALIRFFRGLSDASRYFIFLIFILYLLFQAYLIYSVGVNTAENIEQANSNALTLTGRAFIWNAALKVMEGHWLLGPGWSNFSAYMAANHPDLVVNVHNLFLSTAVHGGLLAVAFLVIYMFGMLSYSIDRARQGAYFPLAFFIMLCVRVNTESGFFEGNFNSPVLISILIYMRILTSGGTESSTN